MSGTLLNQGITLMLAGMGTVFVFLTTLVAAMTIMASIIRKIRPSSSSPSAEEVAAISAALSRHRNQ
ncbi:MAG: OadG family protein [Woeseiaceae bacterium]